MRGIGGVSVTNRDHETAVVTGARQNLACPVTARHPIR